MKIEIKGLNIRLPQWVLVLPNIVRFPIPGVPDRMRAVVGVSLSTSAAVVVGGFLLATMVGSESAPVWPDPAEYTVPNRVGEKLPVDEPGVPSQTLELNLIGRVGNITFKNMSLGKSGLTDAFQINASSTRYLVCDDVIVRDSEFPTLDMANGEVFQLNATSSVLTAGHTVSPSSSTTTADIVVGASRETGDWVSDGGTVDRIILTTTGTGDVVCDTLLIEHVRASVGAFNADYFKVGTWTFENVRVGDDGDIDSADFIINSSVSYTNFNDGIVDQPIKIQ